MKAILALAMVVSCSVCCGQWPAWGYMNRYEAMQQQAWENQLRLRQQQAWEDRTPERNYVLDWREQEGRIRATKEQERYYRRLNEQLDSRPANPFFDNPFMRR
jgi:hypothetical protein